MWSLLPFITWTLFLKCFKKFFKLSDADPSFLEFPSAKQFACLILRGLYFGMPGSELLSHIVGLSLLQMFNSTPAY